MFVRIMHSTSSHWTESPNPPSQQSLSLTGLNPAVITVFRYGQMNLVKQDTSLGLEITDLNQLGVKISV